MHPAPLVLLLLTAGCSTATSSGCDAGTSCAAPLVCATDGSARENAPPEVVRVPEVDADLTLVVSNAGGPAERVVVRAGGRLLLDALLPPGSDHCGHPPVFRWSYDLPDGEVTVDVRAAGQTGRVVARRWVTVMTQESLPLHVTATDTAPAFG